MPKAIVLFRTPDDPATTVMIPGVTERAAESDPPRGVGVTSSDGGDVAVPMGARKPDDTAGDIDGDGFTTELGITSEYMTFMTWTLSLK